MTWSKVKWIIYTSTKKCVLGQITDEIIWYYFISIKQTLRMLWHSECAAAQVSVPVVTFLVCCSGAFNISKVSLLTWNSSLVSLQPTCNISTLIYPFIWSCLDILVKRSFPNWCRILLVYSVCVCLLALGWNGFWRCAVTWPYLDWNLYPLNAWSLVIYSCSKSGLTK